jgi:hypothetical protein
VGITTVLWAIEILLSRDDADLDRVVKGYLRAKED